MAKKTYHVCLGVLADKIKSCVQNKELAEFFFTASPVKFWMEFAWPCSQFLFNIHASVSDLYILRTSLPILLQQNWWAHGPI
jgi:hypothetical protein